jgi:HD-GYP domain-containing protein (c-di-GMP phosphodiesterase class II)
MKKLSVKILLLISLILGTSMFFTVFYVNRSERKMILEEAFSDADRTSLMMFNFMISMMSLTTSDSKVDTHELPDLIFESANKHEANLLEVRLIHSPGIEKTLRDKKIAATYMMNETEFPKDEKEKEALAGKETKETLLREADGKIFRAVRYLMPIKAERKCISCHFLEEGEPVAAISSIISIESAFQKLERRTIWNIVFIGLGFCLIISVLFLSLHGMVSKPLQHMTGIVRIITEEGDLANTVEIKSGGEIGELATAFNRMNESLRERQLEIIYRLSRSAEHRDEETGKHVQRTSLYAAALARKMGFDKKTVEYIFNATPMHDLGKIGIPDRILLKPGKLDSEEWEIMKQHPLIGAQILAGSEVPFIRMAERIALTHHEKWDGSGYPNGLKGEDISIEGQIVAIADVFDVLTSIRPYRKKPFLDQEAFTIMREERGKHFKPELLDAFLSIEDEILKIKNSLVDQDVSFLSRLSPKKQITA